MLLRHYRSYQGREQVNGKIIKEVHSCGLLSPNPYKYAVGTIWQCDCGNNFELIVSRGRVPELFWQHCSGFIKGDNKTNFEIYLEEQLKNPKVRAAFEQEENK